MWPSAATWLAAAVLVLNLPFGFWRAGLRKLSLPWFAAIHVPVPLTIGMRFLVHVPFRLVALPIFVGAFFSGQWIGGRVRARVRRGATGRSS